MSLIALTIKAFLNQRDNFSLMAEKIVVEKKEEAKRWFKDWHIIILIAVILLAFVLRIYVYNFTANQPIWWDEGDYLYTAKRWGLDLETRDLWYYRRTFFWPLMLAGMLKLGFGEHALRFLTVLFSTGTVAMTYLAGKELFDKRVGLVAAFIMAVARLPLFLGGRLLTETPAAFFILTGYYFFIKGYMKKQGDHFIYLSAVMIAFGMFTRWATLLSLIPLIIYLLCVEKFRIFTNKKLWIFAGIILAIIAPFLIAYSQNYPAGISDFVTHYTATPEGQEAFMLGVPGIWGYFTDLLPNASLWFFAMFILGMMIFIDMIIAPDMLFKKEEIARKLFFFLWILTPLVFHGMYSEYVDERYILWAYPMIFMLAGIGMMKIFDLLKKYNKYLGIGFIVIIVVLGGWAQLTAARNITLDKRYSYQAVMESGYWLKANTNRDDTIISQSRPQHGYYSERSVYSYTQAKDAADFEKMLQKYNPKYMVISVFESSAPQWSYAYGGEHNLSIANAWYSDEERTKPIVVVYQLR